MHPRTNHGLRRTGSLGLALCVLGLAIGSNRPALAARFARVNGPRIVNADSEPQSWLTHGRTYSEQRFSPLAQINSQNVADLGLAWSFATGTKHGLEATPLVIDGVMYTTASRSIVYALDAASGRELWRYDPHISGRAARRACCDVVNRGVAAWKGRIYVATFDGYLVALDAGTGKPVWKVLTVDPALSYTITGAPRIVKDKVFIGNGGAEFGVRGYFTAYDAASGRQLWRFYTVPANPSKPVENPALAIAARTWPADSMWEAGLGGTVWDSMAYDPEADLLYVGVGNSSPYNRKVRSPGGGDNLFLASILAVRPDSGELVWYYQTTPGESWDYTATQHMILADLHIDGRLRKVLMQAPKNGFFYVLDRITGELISAEKYVYMNWASHVDMQTGRPVETGDADWSKGMTYVVPGPPGGHNWPPMSYDPQTGLVYIPTLQFGWFYFPLSGYRFIPGAFNTSEDFPALGRWLEWRVPFCSPSQLTAWDPIKQEKVWQVDHDHPVSGGVLSTAGGLIFQGDGSGAFSAYAAETGKPLWHSEIGIAVMAPPIAYALDGQQFIAVMAGVGGSPAINHLRFDYVNDGRLLVYKLGGHTPMPAVHRRKPGKVDVSPMNTSPAQISRGEDLFSMHCARCHGFQAKSLGLWPDLRYSARSVHDSWDAIVRGGAFDARGMGSFADLLDAEESRAIHAYVIDRALHTPTFAERAHDWIEQHVCVPAWLPAQFW